MINPNATRRDVEQFLLRSTATWLRSWGSKVTLNSTNGSAAGPRIDLLINGRKRRLLRKRWAAPSGMRPGGKRSTRGASRASSTTRLRGISFPDDGTARL